MANLSSSQFSNISGPSDAELAGIESGSSEAESYGSFTPEQVEGLRKMNEKIDPAYARTRNKAGTAFSGSNRNASVGGAKRATAGDALTSLESAEGVSGLGGLVSNKEVVSSDFDPADFSRSISGSGSGALSGQPSRYYEEHSNQPMYQLGGFLLRTAGRCDHPRCQAIRAKGMELMGADTRVPTNREPWKSSVPPIPSRVVVSNEYPIINGKQSRKNVIKTEELVPVDPKHPEYQAYINAGKAKTDTRHEQLDKQFGLAPQDLLEHHHPAGDMDFEKYPLPWDA